MRLLRVALGAILAVGVFFASLGVEAQQRDRRRIAFLGPTGREPIEVPFWQGLRDLGWIENENLMVERRRAGGGGQLYPQLAKELVGLNPDLLVSIATPATAAVTATTTTIPIVFVDVADPVASGFVATLARPGRNATGISGFNTELSAKRVELLHAAVPKLTSAAIIACCFGTPLDPILQKLVDDTRAAARTLRITAHPLALQSYDPDAVFARIAGLRVDAVIVLPSAQTTVARHRTADLATEYRLPMIGDDRLLAEAGSLMTFGIDRVEVYRRAASLVDRVLRGAKPADIPVEQPTKFRFVINLKTAKTLGLTIPPSVLLRADQVIE